MFIYQFKYAHSLTHNLFLSSILRSATPSKGETANNFNTAHTQCESARCDKPDMQHLKKAESEAFGYVKEITLFFNYSDCGPW